MCLMAGNTVGTSPDRERFVSPELQSSPVALGLLSIAQNKPDKGGGGGGGGKPPKDDKDPPGGGGGGGGGKKPPKEPPAPGPGTVSGPFVPPSDVGISGRGGKGGSGGGLGRRKGLSQKKPSFLGLGPRGPGTGTSL